MPNLESELIDIKGNRRLQVFHDKKGEDVVEVRHGLRIDGSKIRQFHKIRG